MGNTPENAVHELTVKNYCYNGKRRKERQELGCNEIGVSKKNSLKKATLGVFHNTIPRDVVDQDTYNKLEREYLVPYFHQAPRFVSPGSFFEVSGVKFKVLSTELRSGFVTKSTEIQLYQQLETIELRVIRLVPLSPSTLSQETFDSHISPYLHKYRQHINKDQVLPLRKTDCIVAKCSPGNGVIGPNTIIEYEELPYPPIRKLMICSTTSVPATKLLDSHIIPYFNGWNRVLYSGEVLDINGNHFRIYCLPSFGIAHEETAIELDPVRIERLGNGQTMIETRSPETLKELLENKHIMVSMLKDNQVDNKGSGFRLKRLPTSEEQKICVICWNEFCLKNEVQALDCTHIFHRKCIEKWESYSRFCPICKNSLDSD